jgi:hypothetical protein
VNVDELQLHLSNLAHLLENAGGAKTAKALADFCQRLQPYRDRRVTDVLALLDQAEEIVRTGTPPPRKGRTAKPKADPQALEAAANRIVELYHRAKEPDTTREQIEAAFAELERLEPTLPKLKELAKRLDITRTLKKADAISAMKQAVLERKGAFQRVEV